MSDAQRVQVDDHVPSAARAIALLTYMLNRLACLDGVLLDTGVNGPVGVNAEITQDADASATHLLHGMVDVARSGEQSVCHRIV